MGWVLSGPDGPAPQGVAPVVQAAGLVDGAQGGGGGSCTVFNVVDGDTVDVDCGSGRDRVRLLDIDTPERGEPGFHEATEALKEMIGDGDVRLGYEEPGQPSRGTYGRLLAYLYDADGTNLNEQMIRHGWSEYWTKYGEGRFPDEFAAAESEAREDGRGLWGES